MDLRIFNTKQAVADHFSEYFMELAKGREEFHVALSGGSTPKLIFDVLRLEYKDQINWRKVHFYWGDERCVPPSDDQSNYKMTREHLLSGIEIPSENIHRILGENDPLDEAIRYGELLGTALPLSGEVPQFDLVILGMGDDGHTASIFPHEIHLWDSDRNCELAEHPDTKQKRVTITGKVINNASHVSFLVTGDTKARKVKEIIHQLAGSEIYPASRVAPISGKLSWFLDAEAAKGVTSV